MKTVRRLLLLLLLAFVSGIPGRAGAGEPSLAESLPEGAIGYIEFSGFSDVIRAVRQSRTLEAILTTDEFRKYEASPEYLKATAFRAMAELVLGAPLWDVSADLFSGRLAVALYPDPEHPRKPLAVAVLRPAETKTLTRVQEALSPLLAASVRKIDTAELYPGASLWSWQDQVFLGLHGSWVVAAQQRAMLERTLALLAGAADKGAPLARQSGFAGMEKVVGGEHHVRAWVDTPHLVRLMGDRFGLPQKFQDGAASLIFGGLVELAARSPFAAATLDLRGQEMEGVLTIGGEPAQLPELSALWFTQHPACGVIALPRTPGTIAGITLHRKLGEWYRHRDQLLADHLLPAFDKFETDIGNLLPRKDFGQDVLPLIGDNFTFVSALQNYDHLDGKPGIQLPAFALIFELAKPKEGADLFQLFFQTLSSILNLQAGQEGREPSVLDTEVYRDTKISLSRYLSKPSGDRLPIAYNFQPAAACVGSKYILATSVQYCRDLIDHFKRPEAGTWQNRNAEMIVDAGALAALAELNEGALRSEEIRKGSTPEHAEKRTGLLISLLKQFQAVHYHSATASGQFQMHLHTSWK